MHLRTWLGTAALVLTLIALNVGMANPTASAQDADEEEPTPELISEDEDAEPELISGLPATGSGGLAGDDGSATGLALISAAAGAAAVAVLGSGVARRRLARSRRRA
ncbi:MAG TPA: hypothetical protein QGF05_04640 [Dehalococcoidia bacterium]|nr:hypothetical protein [Dehalococcoidia bacterium]